jgi:hypothetical protein
MAKKKKRNANSVTLEVAVLNFEHISDMIISVKTFRDKLTLWISDTKMKNPVPFLDTSHV